ncbi:MAG: aspartate 1-decarboxylase [Planctomycetota bacterium]|nr:MAG: aspartate 1-decarboxylase [Planctomycetota bacterium]REJ95817.1 MAG: aspartate 1-decarboxylase [Planctomycetota bacterium]REK27277.1 MAG: aspartate 1-decarboxylase [Planctomycetota bacterium]REK36702.1 MAG: aspartate 1-decarboxylase [Planctomycetota bacterium]
MQLQLLKSKLHMATVTAADLHYHGSVGISADLMETVGLLPYEKVLIGNCSTGQRGETYVIRKEAGSGEIQMNGAMARLAAAGDRLIILAFAALTPEEAGEHHPRIAVLDERNRVVEQWEG